MTAVESTAESVLVLSLLKNISQIGRPFMYTAIVLLLSFQNFKGRYSSTVCFCNFLSEFQQVILSIKLKDLKVVYSCI
jgi:hypothetical protein